MGNQSMTNRLKTKHNIGFFIFFATLFISGCSIDKQSESSKLQALYDDIWDHQMITFPTYATYVGYPGQNHRWSDPSLDAKKDYEASRKIFLERLMDIKIEDLPEDQRLGLKLIQKSLSTQIKGFKFPEKFILIHQRSGVQQDIPDILSVMSKNSKSDFDDRLMRLKNAPEYIAKTIDVLRAGLEQGITPPKITLRDVPQQIMNTIPSDINVSPLLTSFNNFPTNMTAEEIDQIKEDAKTVIEMQVYPAFQNLYDFLVEEYIPNANESIALSDNQNGREWYRHRARQFTTTDLSPEEIHELGLREVERIKNEMDNVITNSGFNGTFNEFTHFLRTDPQFYAKTAEELLAGYRDIAKKADPELPKLFGKLPRMPYGVIEIPSYAAKSQTTAFYRGGSEKDGRAGYFYANTYALNTRPKWEMEALTLHEAMPGHHLQISLAKELPETHPLLQNLSYTGFVEGWGLYAESLGTEMGFYKDPYSKFGQLTYEMWRAVRLVVDTGMHYFGWSRERSINYFASNTAKSLHDIEVEIDRYISWPGQALAYKIGELKFKELRRRSKQHFGDKFNIRDFHDELHKRGALPLDVLEDQINDWMSQ